MPENIIIMNKKSLILCIILILSGLQSYSQEKITTHLENGYLIGQAIVPLKGKTAAEIYNSSLDWVANTFVRTNSVLLAKVPNQMIRIRGNITLNRINTLFFHIQIDIQKGKLRFTATNLIISTPGIYLGSTAKFYASQLLFRKNGEIRKRNNSSIVKQQVDSSLSALLSSLTMTIKGQKKDNW